MRCRAPTATLVVVGALVAASVGAAPARAASDAITTSEAKALVREALGTVEAGDRLVVVEARPDGDVAVASRAVDDLRDAARFVRQASAGGDLVAVSADPQVEAMGDPSEPSQWALEATTFRGAWARGARGAGVVVAVVDTGVDASHPDLTGQVLTGWRFLNGDGVGVAGGGSDPNGHGTHVAGTIAMVAGNGVGGVGAAPAATILPVRVLGASGSGNLSDVVSGIDWAVDHGARIVNLSLGSTVSSPALDAVIASAVTRGVLVVAAAGNAYASGNPLVWPAANDQTLAVGSVGWNLGRSAFSSAHPYVDLAAPGEGIVGPAPGGGYVSMSGTSMAAPFASAAAAIVLGAAPTTSVAQLRNALEGSARDLGPAGRDDETGAGLLDPAAALASVIGAAPVPPVAPTRSAPRAAVVGSSGVLTIAGGIVKTVDAGLPAGVRATAASQTASGAGGWASDAAGRVYVGGDAELLGDLRDVALNRPINAMSPTPSGRGYWMSASDGGIFTFGDAPFLGSLGAIRLNQPIVAMATTPTGRGYWMVAADGGVFTFGDAGFFGSTGAVRLARPITGIAPTPTGRGYWLFADDGGIFAFGDAPFLGALPQLPLGANRVALGLVPTDSGAGYWTVTADLAVFAFGDATPPTGPPPAPMPPPPPPPPVTSPCVKGTKGCPSKKAGKAGVASITSSIPKRSAGLSQSGAMLHGHGDPVRQLRRHPHLGGRGAGLLRAPRRCYVI